MVHDFIRFPELTNGQMQFYYFESPHKQITSDFRATVIKVIDGDTISVRVAFRDFDFPIRFLDTNAPEMSEGGQETKDWLENIILGEEIEVKIDKRQRVGKWGRLLGNIIHRGVNLNQESIRTGRATSFENRNEGKLPDLNKELSIDKWL